MSTLETIGWILSGVFLLNCFVIAATCFLNKIEKKNKMEDTLFLGKLTSSNESIRDVVKYLKLTNSIASKYN